MNLEQQVLALVMVVPLMTAPIVALLRNPDLCWSAATAASVMMLALAADVARRVLDVGEVTYAMGGWAPPEGIELQIGAFGALVLLVVTGSSTLALLGGRRNLAEQVAAGRHGWFYAAWLLALAGLSGILVTGDAFNLFVFMEVSSLATYVMIASGPDRRALTASFKYLVMGTVGATFYLIGVGLIYMMTGTLNIADMAVRLGEIDVVNRRPLVVASGFITVGLALKAALFPLHAWLPRAYARAPHAVTVFIAACATKVAIFVLLSFEYRVFQGNLPGYGAQFSGFLMPLALLGMLIGSAVAMFEDELQRLLAWSSIGQIGYILLGAGLGGVVGLSGSIVHVLAHGLAKGAAFLAVVALASRYRSLRIRDLGGAFRRMPWTMGGFTVAGLSLIGMPGTAGFVSKLLLIRAAMDSGPAGFLAVAAILLASLMAVVYVWRVVEQAAFGEPTGVHEPGEAPLAVLIALWLAAGGSIYFGLTTELPLGLAGQAAEGLLGHVDGR